MSYKYSNPFYKTKRWKRKRVIVLKKYDYLCVESKQYGIARPAEVVHHIYPLEKYPELAYVEWNLLPMTNSLHNTFHDRDSDEIIGRGLYWQDKRRKEFEFHYKKKEPTI